MSRLRRGGRFLRGLECLELGEFLGHVDAREERLALVHRDVRGQHAPDGGIVPRGLLRRGADLREGFRAAVGHEGQQQRDGDAQRLEQVIQHRGQARALALVLGEDPGRRLVDILIGAGDDLEHLDERLLRAEIVHIAGIRPAQRGCHGDELVVERIVLALGRERAAEVLDDHGDGAAQEVAEVVGEVGIDAGDEQLVGEVAVTAKRELAQEVIAQRVHTVALGEQDGVDDVALRLRHLAAVDDEPAFGRGMPMLMSIAGQMMEWKRTISLPTMCTSAGQNFS